MQTQIDDNEWKTAGTGIFWKPENKGDTLEGELLEEFEGKYGTCYKIKCADGTVQMTPSYKALISRMTEVQQGMLVKITYEGEELPKTKGFRPTKLFLVQYREAR